MLISLSIDHIAVIESQTLVLGPALNALTGETGAGKSVVLAALGLALGRRGSVELVRTGAESASVEARFSLAHAPQARMILRRADLPGADEPELVVRRTLNSRGAGRATVNRRAVPMGLLAELGRALVDVAGQHDSQGLLDPDTHLDLLDEAGGLGAERAEMESAWHDFQAATAELRRLTDAAGRAEERAAWIRAQLDELDALKPRADEEAALLAERDRLRHAVELGQGVRLAEGLLYSGERAATDRISAAEAALRRVSTFDPSLEPLVVALREAAYQLEDVARALQGLGRRTADPGRLDEVETRLAELDRVARKHRCVPADLPLRHERLRQELSELEHLDDAIGGAQAEVGRRLGAATLLAARLRERRVGAAGALQGRVQLELRELAMPHARFEVALEPLREGVTLPDGRLLGPAGLDCAELRLSANPGEELRPMHRVASGGELSRLLLAVKLALRAGGRVTPTLVFDEVDAGLGGLAADELGRRLGALARDAQVLCVTHQAQIAAMADTHLAVVKGVSEGRTRTALKKLTGQERVLEIARMLGGSDEVALSFSARLLGRGGGARPEAAA